MAMLDGKKILRRSDGTISTEIQYKKGVPHGECIEYYPNGKIMSKRYYENGILVNTCTYYKKQPRTMHGNTPTEQDSKISVVYTYSAGKISESMPYYHGVKFGKYHVGSLLDLGDETSIPMGYILHMDTETHPAELYPNTTWKKIEADIHSKREDGSENTPVHLWMRVPSEETGPTILMGGFEEYGADGSSVIRTGSHYKQSDDNGHRSVLDKTEQIRRDGRTSFLTQQWKQGMKDGTTTYFMQNGTKGYEYETKNQEVVTASRIVHEVVSVPDAKIQVEKKDHQYVLKTTEP